LSQAHFAKSLLHEAKLRLTTAKTALLAREYAYCIRQNQEAAELGVKAALRLVGIDYPKWHDVGNVLQAEVARFPAWFQVKGPDLAKASLQLAALRESSMYGDDVLDLSPEDLFTIHDARQALTDAQRIISQVQKLVREVRQGSQKA
jgi:HEPN domain-containing protein